MKIHFFDRHLRQVHRTFIHIFIICCIQRRGTCFRTTALTVFVNFWPLSFFRLKLCWHIWMHWFLSHLCFLIGAVSGLVTGIIFSFPFLSPARSDFGSRAGRAEQQHVISLCLCSLQGLQADKKNVRAAYEWQTQIWNSWLLLSVLLELNQVGHQLYPQLNKKLRSIRAQMEAAVTA